MESSPLRISRAALRESLADPNSLMDLFSKRTKSLSSANKRMLTSVDALHSLDPVNDPLGFEVKTELPDSFDSESGESFGQYLQDLADKKWDDEIRRLDRNYTDGFLLADTATEIARCQVQAFQPLPMIDWENGLPYKRQNLDDVVERSYRTFIDLMHTRQLQLGIYDMIKDSLSGTATQDFQIPNLERYASFRKSGFRWRELIELFGVEEILLYNKGQSITCSGNALQTLNIDRIVKSGTDEDFDLLKKNLGSPHYAWLRETVMSLKGVLIKLEKSRRSADSGDWDTSLALAVEIGAQVNKVFGSRSCAIENFMIEPSVLEEACGKFFKVVILLGAEQQTTFQNNFMSLSVEAFRVVARESDQRLDEPAAFADLAHSLQKQFQKHLDFLMQTYKEHEWHAARAEAILEIESLLSEGFQAFMLATGLQCLCGAMDYSCECESSRDESSKDKRIGQSKRCVDIFKRAFSIAI